MTNKDRKALKEQIWEQLSINHNDTYCSVQCQKRPYTMVEIRHWAGDSFFSAIGFAKVNWPDQWDEKKGLEIAAKKAISDIVRQMEAYYEGQEGVGWNRHLLKS